MQGTGDGRFIWSLRNPCDRPTAPPTTTDRATSTRGSVLAHPSEDVCSPFRLGQVEQAIVPRTPLGYQPLERFQTTGLRRVTRRGSAPRARVGQQPLHHLDPSFLRCRRERALVPRTIVLRVPQPLQDRQVTSARRSLAHRIVQRTSLPDQPSEGVKLALPGDPSRTRPDPRASNPGVSPATVS